MLQVAVGYPVIAVMFSRLAAAFEPRQHFPLQLMETLLVMPFCNENTCFVNLLDHRSFESGVFECPGVGGFDNRSHGGQFFKDVRLRVDVTVNYDLAGIDIVPSRLEDIYIGRPLRKRFDLDNGCGFGRESGIVVKVVIIRPDE